MVEWMKPMQDPTKLIFAPIDDAENNLRNTPLLLAVKGGHLSAITLLLKKGADIDVKNKIKETALSVAEVSGNDAVLNMLKTHAEGRSGIFDFLN